MFSSRSLTTRGNPPSDTLNLCSLWTLPFLMLPAGPQVFPALIKRKMITFSPHCPQWFPQSFQLVSFKPNWNSQVAFRPFCGEGQVSILHCTGLCCFCLSHSSAPPLALGGPRMQGRMGQGRPSWAERLKGMCEASFSCLIQSTFTGLRTHIH